MKFLRTLPLLLAAILLLSTTASAWGPKTREYFCRSVITETWGEEAYAKCFVSTRIEEMCSLVDGGYRDACLNFTSMPWDMPDVVFQDTEKHHDYSMCPINGFASRWLCGDEGTAPARDKAREWFTRARNLGAGCKSLYAFCVGADYQAKRFFQPNQIMFSDPECEEHLKEKVDAAIGSAETWSERTRCSYEYWEPRAGQKMKVSENPVFIVNKNRIDTIVGGLTAEAERLATYQGGVQALNDAVGIQSTTTSTTMTASTTTVAQTTTTISPQTTTTSVSQTSTSTTVALASTTTVQPAKAPETTSVAAQAETPKKAAGSARVWIVGIVILLLAGAYAAVSSRARKQQPVTHEHAQEEPFQKPKKKRKEPTLRDIKGLGKVAEDRLRSHGIDSLKKLLEADTGEIAEETGISEERIHAWKQKAEELIGGMRTF